MIAIKAVIFDMDGVIVDSEPLHEQAQRVVFSRFDLTVPSSVFTDYKGMTEEDVFGHIVHAYADGRLDPAELVAMKHDVYRTLMEDLVLIDAVLPFIERLSRSGYPLGLTTSAARRDQQRTFDLFGLHRFFDVVVTAEDVSRPKPDPEPYLTTTRRLAAPPAACLVIEDSTNGVRSARGAGCRVAGLTTSFSADQLTRAGAHVTVDRFDELARHLHLNAL